MHDTRGRLLAAVLLVAGLCALVGGTTVAVMKTLAILSMVGQALVALWSWVPVLTFTPSRDPVPQFDFFAPTLLLLGGILVLLLGWVAIIRGVGALWPARLDRSRGDQS